jgi:hypothetical protein
MVMLPGTLLWLPSLECKPPLFPCVISFNDVHCRTHQDVVLPLGTPIKGVDGTEIHEIPILKGTRILINITACNNAPTIWGEDAHEWKPERWLQSFPDSVSSARIPGVFSHLLV